MKKINKPYHKNPHPWTEEGRLAQKKKRIENAYRKKNWFARMKEKGYINKSVMIPGIYKQEFEAFVNELKTRYEETDTRTTD